MDYAEPSDYEDIRQAVVKCVQSLTTGIGKNMTRIKNFRGSSTTRLPRLAGWA